MERDNADPCAAVECVEFEAGGNEKADLVRIYPPVHEKQVVPLLNHYPRRVWDGPGAIQVEDWLRHARKRNAKFVCEPSRNESTMTETKKRGGLRFAQDDGVFPLDISQKAPPTGRRRVTV